MQPHEPMERHPADGPSPRVERRWLALLFAMAFLLLTVGLGKSGFEGRDERRYARVAFEVGPGEDFFVMHFMGELYPDKPPLMFWSQALAYRLTGGLSPLGARLPLVPYTLGALAFAYFAMRRLGGARVALLALAMLTVAFRFAHSGRFARLDMAMCCFTFGSFWATARILFPYAGERAAGLGVVLWGWAAAGLAILAKGPGFLVWWIALGAFAAARRDWSVVRAHRPLLGVPVMLAVPALWFVPAALLGGMDYIGPMVGTHVVERAIGAVRHEEPFHYFWHKILYDSAPVGPVLPFAAWLLWSGRRALRERPGLQFAALWLLLGLVFFSLPTGKRSLYILPLYPAAALLAAHTLWAAQERAHRGVARGLWLMQWGASALLLLAAPMLLWLTFGFGEGLRESPPAWVNAGFALPIALAAGASLLQLKRGRLVASMACLVLAVHPAYWWLHAALFPINRDDTVAREMAARIEADGGAGAAAAVLEPASDHHTIYGRFPSFEFDNNGEARTWLLAAPGRFLITSKERLEEFRANPATPPLRSHGVWFDPQRGRDFAIVSVAPPAAEGDGTDD
ncbi:MAG: glycosyltransferase family 39 protein [Candidatus Sumerlaeia bacterium]|nr:glycosyltransferase family 39 protein [Candidatus Sumerlaeia bacterium]